MIHFHRRLFLAGLVLVGLGPIATPAPAAEGDLTVFAAASLSTVLETAGAAFTAASGQPVTFSFAASGSLARQIEAGAPADVFITADLTWMDWAAERSLIDPATRRVIARNDLVLIAPADAAAPLDLAAPTALADALGADGRLAMGEPASVPAGAYGKAALTALGLFAGVEGRLAPTESVRAALALVATGEASLGIVYATDAKVEPEVAVVAAFPADSHEPIVYPAAVTAGSDTPSAAAFLDFLESADGQAIFAAAGFRPAPPRR